jgi:hypothetical protein
MKLHASIVAVTFAPVGDSNTSAITNSLQEGLQAGTWVSQALAPQYGLGLRGGWAKRGATSADAAANVTAWRPNVAVIMIGTNDLQLNWTYSIWSIAQANILTIASTVGAGSVVLSELPPLNRYPRSELLFNQHLVVLAKAEGWTLVDPWASFRAANGTWKHSSDAQDGVHGTLATWDVVGDRLGASIFAAGR